MDDFFKNDNSNDDFLADFTTPEKQDDKIDGYSRESRRKKVENFKLTIEEDTEYLPREDEKKHDTVSNRPKSNGEVYFANYQRGQGTPQPKKYSDNVKPQTGSDNPMYDVDMFSDSSERTRPPQDRPVSKTNQNKKKKKKILSPEEIKKLRDAYSRTFYIAMVCVLVFTVALSTVGIQCINDALAFSASAEEVEVTISDNTTTSEAIEIFHEKGLIKVRWFARFFAKFRGYDEDGIHYTWGGEEKVQPYVGGTYYLSSDMGIEGMLNILLDNSASSEQTVNITFPEGYTIAQIVSRLEDYEIISDEKKFINASNYDYTYDFLDNKNDGTALKLEGYLFPDTYDMYIGESTSSIIKRFLENFDEKWSDKYEKRAKELGLTVSEVLTIASIIQKEAAGSAQMADISSVIHNRLERSTYYPMLQCDSTALYVTNYLNDLLGPNKANSYLAKYDTAMCMGLPEGPICNPGLDAINAALYPSDTTYLYFCHDKSGNVYYASTDYEHQQNVAKIR